ncbi:MAG TPA: hypothetical protein VHR41_18420 [Gemmatimonadales bacterium]|jgi:hypothetical protein|nr:hypothetical protein [Gemmatimonadales bacterium]
MTVRVLQRPTAEELKILKAVRETTFHPFFPTGRSIAEAEAFDVRVELLKRMQQEGWIELEVSPSRSLVGGYQRKYRAALARCTDLGREGLKSFGE